MVDTADSKSAGVKSREGSNPSSGTKKTKIIIGDDNV